MLVHNNRRVPSNSNIPSFYIEISVVNNLKESFNTVAFLTVPMPSKILFYTQKRRSNTVPSLESKPFSICKNKISMQDCILCGYRSLVPKMLWKLILLELHFTYMAIVKMKKSAQSTFWWSSTDKKIEECPSNFGACRTNSANPSRN